MDGGKAELRRAYVRPAFHDSKVRDGLKPVRSPEPPWGYPVRTFWRKRFPFWGTAKIRALTAATPGTGWTPRIVYIRFLRYCR